MTEKTLRDYICSADISRKHTERNRITKIKDELEVAVICVDRLITQAVLLGNSSVCIDIYDRDILGRMQEFLQHRGYGARIRKDRMTIDWS